MNKPNGKLHSKTKLLLAEPPDKRTTTYSHRMHHRENNLNFTFIKIITSHQNLLLKRTSPKPKPHKCSSAKNEPRRFSDFLYQSFQAGAKTFATELTPATEITE
jgi:hypothetical protein